MASTLKHVACGFYPIGSYKVSNFDEGCRRVGSYTTSPHLGKKLR